ncbi:monovalent cation/H+ antiporter subunit D family protein [Thermobifida halotolerans]|uniref:Monovalent cation/H+ antiporter subunit D family protein n=1 Tax=Thermobifida halotolerans TaxID=483545 RepID=A0A399FYF2_9ACTN|nr:monovalent cation/H+ antiporter subunit D family protein [Thermobifida halotolerans]UOE19353.1 monovalent cation/H+ antiporter subunit D family protein [Thermobifida halotolerans]
MTDALLPLAAAGPLGAAALLAWLPRSAGLRTGVLFAVLTAALGWSCALLAATGEGAVLTHTVGGWPGGLVITFAADAFSSLMLVTTSLLILACTGHAAASGHTRQRHFASLVLVLTGGVHGALLTADLFNLFVFLEVMLVPSYALLSVFGGRSRIAAGRLYLTVSLLASTLLLAGVAAVYALTGTVNTGALAGAAREAPAVAVAGAAVLLALFVKAAVVPVHGWLANTYPYTSPAVSALFSGVQTKVAIYVVYRVYAVLYDGDTRYLWLGLVVFTVTMVVGVLGAVGEKTTRSILSFHMISQIGYILLGVALFGAAGLAAGIFYMLHNMVVKASLFLSTGAVETVHSTGRLDRLGGLGRREPVLAFLFIASAFSLAGLPPLSGFVAKFVLVQATVAEQQYVVATVAVVVSLLTLMSMAKIWNGVFWDRAERSGDDSEAPRVPVSLLLAPALLTAVTLAVGVFPGPVLQWCETAAEGLANTDSYAAEVSRR